MKTVQIPRGPTTQESVIVGAAGQLRFDESRGTLRIHDGVTRGGFELPNTELVQQLIATGGAAGASGVIQYFGTEAELAESVPSANALAVVNEEGLEEIYTWKPGANDGGGISSSVDGWWHRTDSAVGHFVRLWRANLIDMQINGSQPVVNQDETVWLINGVAKIWDGATYEAATPVLYARLLAMVGGYAVGAVVLPNRLLDTLVAVADADAVTDSGWYKSSAADANVPSATVSVLEHRKISAAEMMQTFYLQASSTYVMYRRFKTASVWGAWTQLLTLLPDRLGATAATVANADLALDSGFYRMVSGGTNMPVVANGVLIVSRYSSTEASQMFMRTSNGVIYTRGYAGAAFTAWQIQQPLTQANLETVLNAMTAKATVVDADKVVVLDSAAAFVGKLTTLTQVWTGWLKAKTDALYAALVHTHVQSDVTNLVADLALKAPLASPTLTGIPLAPTAAAATSTTQIASTAFVTTADNLKANLASPIFTGTPAAPTPAPGTNTTQLATTAFHAAGIAALTKASVGLGNVDNTSDANKPVSTAEQTALNLKANLASPTFTGTVAGITKAMVGLGSVDNTADTSKPVSTAQQTALDLKANLASPTFTGTVAGITKSMVGLGSVDNTTDAAKPVSTATQTALNLKANLAGPTFTGTVAGITKSMVGLGNVDNTADSAKSVSFATSAGTMPWSGLSSVPTTIAGYGITDGGGETFLGTITTTSGSSQALGSLVLTSYKSVRIALNNVLGTSATATLRLNGNDLRPVMSGSANNFWDGMIIIDLNYSMGIYTLTTWSPGHAARIGTASDAGILSIGTATTTITFSLSAGTFGAGTIRVYGVR